MSSTATSPRTRRRRWRRSCLRPPDPALSALPPDSIASRYGGILLDIDGVVRRGREPVVGAAEAIDALNGGGVAIAFVTNNASATPEAVARELQDVGIVATPPQIVTSAMAAAAMIAPATRCLVIGMQGLRRALDQRGCVEVTNPFDAEVVVVGFDRSFDWEALRRANAAIRNGARFIATNTDATFPAADELWPGNGAVVAALQTASGVTPEVAGKPHAPLLHAAAQRVGADPILLVGDRHETDIVGAAALGWDTALVLTGVTAADDVASLRPRATYVLPSIADLVAAPSVSA